MISPRGRRGARAQTLVARTFLLLGSRAMRTHFFWLAVAALSWPAAAAELKFDFSKFPLDQPPPGFHSVVAGEGQPGEWKLVLDDVPSAFQSLTPGAAIVSKGAVLEQEAQERMDEHFPMFGLEGETFDDFTFTTKFKIVSGAMEQMAGVAFRIQNETNYYVVRASALGNNLRFYKVVD